MLKSMTMRRRTRRLLLYAMILFFLITTPAVLFYAWGYGFDFANKKLVLTGGIYLKSSPKKAEIYLNGKFKDQTPHLIKRLIPRDYQIKVVKDGFHSWQKKLKVESKLVTEARNILLVPKNPSVELVKNNLTDNFSLKEFLITDTATIYEFPLPEKQIAGYKIIGQDIFYLQKPSYILYRTNLAGIIQEQMSLSPLPEADYQIIVSSNQKVAVLDDQGKLYLFNQEEKIFEFLAENIQGAQFSNDCKKLLYFTPTEIWVYYLEDILDQPEKKAGEKELITRLSQEIKQAIWYPETNQHIIFSVGQLLKITELDGRDIRNTIDFLEGNVSQIAYDKKTERLYFVEEKKLYRVSLE
jgi:hypothetical protein